MKKWLGYVLSIAGLLIMAAGFGNLNLNIPLLATTSSIYLTILGIFLIILGVFFLYKGDSGKKGKSKKREIPIYEGVGKNRTIVGYRRE